MPTQPEVIGGGALHELPALDLSEEFTYRLPARVGCMYVDRYTGAWGSCVFRRGDPNSVASEIRLRHTRHWNFNRPDGEDIWIVNKAAQAGKYLDLQYGPPGTQIAGSATVVSLEDSTGAAIDPATSDLQQDIIDRLGDVEASPTENSLLERLKVIGDLAGKRFAAMTVGQHTVATGTATQIDSGDSLAIPAGSAIAVKALSTNTVSCFAVEEGQGVGDGWEITKNGEVLVLPVDDRNRLYFISDTASQVICWMILEES